MAVGCIGMSDDRYRSRGWLVKWVMGEKARVTPLPGDQVKRSWRFPGGVAVTDPRLSDALMEAEKMRQRDIQ